MWTRLHWPIEKKEEASYSKLWFRSRGKGIVSELSHDNKLQAMDPEMGEEKDRSTSVNDWLIFLITILLLCLNSTIWKKVNAEMLED